MGRSSNPDTWIWQGQPIRFTSTSYIPETKAYRQTKCRLENTQTESQSLRWPGLLVLCGPGGHLCWWTTEGLSLLKDSRPVLCAEWTASPLTPAAVRNAADPGLLRPPSAASLARGAQASWVCVKPRCLSFYFSNKIILLVRCHRENLKEETLYCTHHPLSMYL